MDIVIVPRYSPWADTSAGVPRRDPRSRRLDAGRDDRARSDACRRPAVPLADVARAAAHDEPGAHGQIWHATYFLAAAEAVRRCIDASHQDYGTTHGYYAKFPRVLATLESRGIPARFTALADDA